MHRYSSGIDSELNFEQKMALHALETAVLCLFPNPYTHLNLGLDDIFPNFGRYDIIPISI